VRGRTRALWVSECGERAQSGEPRSAAIDNLRANGGLQVRSAREPKVIFVRLSFVRGWAERIVGTRVLLKLGREIRLVVIGAD
jgi:hypothetical protein